MTAYSSSAALVIISLTAASSWRRRCFGSASPLYRISQWLAVHVFEPASLVGPHSHFVHLRGSDSGLHVLRACTASAPESSFERMTGNNFDQFYGPTRLCIRLLLREVLLPYGGCGWAIPKSEENTLTTFWEILDRRGSLLLTASDPLVNGSGQEICLRPLVFDCLYGRSFDSSAAPPASLQDEKASYQSQSAKMERAR
jgi:hypothetical protein